MTKVSPKPIDILITRRLTLRPPLEVDIDAIVRGLSDIEVSSCLAMVPQPYEESDAREWLAKRQKSEPGCVYTVHREQLIGVVGVNKLPEGPTLGYWFAKPFWGNGYATEACRAVLARAFRVHKADSIRCSVFDDNTASLRVMDKLGFEQIGKGETFCTALGRTKPDIKAQLTRETFETLFGPLEAKEAA